MMPLLTHLLAETLIARKKAEENRHLCEREVAKSDNSPDRVLWEMGLALVVALSGAALVTIVLRAYGLA